MNKKGYTIIELLAVIAIIGLLFTIAIISYSGLINKANETVYKNYINSMHEAAITYFTDNVLISNETIYLNDLIAQNKIEEINNPKNNSDKCTSTNRANDSYIVATRNDENGVISIEYSVYLKCIDYSGHGDFVN